MKIAVLNSAQEPVLHAQVMVNGVLAVEAPSLQGYVLPSAVRAPFDLEILADGYQPLSSNGWPDLPSQIYMIRTSEEFFYQGRLQVPCCRQRDRLFVVMRDRLNPGHLKPDQARAALASLVSPSKCFVTTISWPPAHPFIKSPNRLRREYAFWVQREDRLDFAEDPYVLEVLRDGEQIAFAGPGYGFVADQAPLVVTGHRVDVLVKGKVARERVIQALATMGYADVQVRASDPNWGISITLGACVAWSIQAHIAQIWTIPSLVNVEAEQIPI